MRTYRWLSFAAVAAALVTTGCTSSSTGASGTTTTTGAASSTSTTTAAPTPTPTPTPTATPAATTAAARTPAELKRALLALADMPPGFQVEPDTGDQDALKASSKSSACAALVKLTNQARPPGSRAGADVGFSGGANGPLLGESLDAMGSAGAAAQFVAGYRKAVSTCPRLTLKLKGAGSSPVRMSEVAAPRVGDSAYATRYAASSGLLAGFELTVLAVQAGDVLVTLILSGAAPEDLDGFASTAMGKVQQVLSVSGGTGV